MGTATVIAILNSPLNFKAASPNQEAVLKTNVPTGTTFVELVNWLGVATDTANSIFTSAKEKYNLATIVSGRELALTFDAFGGGAKRLVYKIDSEQELIVKENESGQWQSEVSPIPYEIKEREIGGVISKSLFETMEAAGLDIRLALALAEMFAWQIDFAADIREGDSFKAIYEERYLDGEYIMPGKILAAQFINEGEASRGYYFPGDEKTRSGHYDEDGNSLQKIFLKSPLQYKYISSGYSFARVNPITKRVSPHRGIDYAAPAGTPAVAVGDGTITQAGWNGYYGISATVRHNDTYRTVYGHFSRLAKGIRVGAKVQQGQVVGYVGSTGQATGPHLHYEMHKFSSHVNPFKVEVPPGEPIHESDRPAFQEIISQYGNRL